MQFFTLNLHWFQFTLWWCLSPRLALLILHNRIYRLFFCCINRDFMLIWSYYTLFLTHSSCTLCLDLLMVSISQTTVAIPILILHHICCNQYSISTNFRLLRLIFSLLYQFPHIHSMLRFILVIFVWKCTCSSTSRFFSCTFVLVADADGWLHTYEGIYRRASSISHLIDMLSGV